MDNRTVLALDLGTSSVGWALFKLGDDKLPNSLVDMGVRHFEEVIEPKSRELKNLARRQARQMRKNLRRRRQRRTALLTILQRAKLSPSGTDPYSASELTTHRPYELRALAVDQKVELEDLGRALYHLGRKRGFKSNRGAKMASLADVAEVQCFLKAPEGDDDSESRKEDGPILTEISQLRSELDGRTLGQYFWDCLKARQKIRGRHTERSMFEEEFERIWTTQSGFYPKVLTNELKAQVWHAMFDQRPLRQQKYLKGPCSLEPSKQRAEKAQLVAQRFRYWQDLSNLELTDLGSGERRRLTSEERIKLAEKLETVASMTLKGIPNELGLKGKWTTNLEQAKGDVLKGNSTAAKVSKRASMLWDDLDEAGRERLIEIMLTINDRGELYRTLRKVFHLEPKVAYDLAIVELEQGTMSLSSKAMRKMLEHLKEGRSRIDAQVACGYEPWSEEIAQVARIESLPNRTDIPNPRVRKALGQVRKVVNAVVAAYGRPAVIRIELAREMTLTKDEKAKVEKSAKDRERENREADEWLAKQGDENPTRTKRFWYRLAKQCGWVCPYTGRAIPSSLDAMNQFQIEHIVPYVRSIDDSFNNLTLCDAEVNRKKGNKTPFEAFGGQPEWEEMVLRIDKLVGTGSKHKKNLFKSQLPPDVDKFVSRQLNETRWICRATAQYLRPICTEVEVTKGAATAMLRSHWGLMEALYGVNEKKRDDLRHHAVDAVAIAFTSRSLFQRISRHRSAVANESIDSIKVAPLSNDVVPPAPSWLFGEIKSRLATVVVSHETQRAIKDAFHEESAYGKKSDGVYHIRKQLLSMKESDIRSIVDDKVREMALNQFFANGKDVTAAFSNGLQVGSTLARRARITVAIPKAPMMAVPDGSPTKYFRLGNNHHVEIFEELSTGKRKGRYVTTLEAAKRVRHEKKPIVDTTPPAPGWRFVTWLCINDSVRVEDDLREHFRVQMIGATNDKIVFRQNAAASVSDDEDRLMKTPNSFKGVKLAVDTLGRVREVPEGVI